MKQRNLKKYIPEHNATDWRKIDEHKKDIEKLDDRVMYEMILDKTNYYYFTKYNKCIESSSPYELKL